MSDQETTTTEQEGIWCVVANVKGERPFGPGGTESRSGTRQFRGGTKVYIVGCYSGSCDGVVAIGLHRHSRRFIACVINVCHVENFRAKVAYHPRVLDLIRQDSRCSIRTKEDAERWAAEFPQWQLIWQNEPLSESAWLASVDPKDMLDVLRGKTSQRKLRLFACACCRRIWPFLSDARSRKAVDIAEEYADGMATLDSLIRARDEATEVRGQFPPLSIIPPSQGAASRAAIAAICATRDNSWVAAHDCMAESSRTVNPQDTNNRYPDELRQQAQLLRCIFGNPFSPAAVDPSWNNGNVVRLAEAIYKERAFDRLPVLADALEDAGCDDEAVLDHCRKHEVHGRGCWVVDSVLSKNSAKAPATDAVDRD